MMQKHRRGPWSSAEDQTLLHLVHSQGAHNWVRISQLIGSRSPKQCRERYHQNLKPSLNLDPITPEEGVMIERMVAEMGKRWAEIARRLNGRSDNAVKNWWNGGVNRRKRLETRRADAAAAARQPHVTVYCPPSSSGPYNPNQPQVSPYGHQQMMQGYHGPPYGVEPRSLPYPAPTPLNTFQAGMHPQQQRRLGEGPLPSPSALSTISRSESCGGAAPSLVSDGGSYTSYSQSPNRSPQSTALPPLASIAGETRHAQQQQQQQSQPQQMQQLQSTQPPPPSSSSTIQHHQQQQQAQFVQSNGTVFPLEDGPYRTPYKSSYPPYHTPYGNQQHEWTDHSQVMQPVVPSQGQLPLAGYRGSAGVESRNGGPPSPPRDSRMNLSNVMS